MKKIIYLTLLLTLFSCNLSRNDSGLYSVVDNNELAKALAGDQWIGISYGIMGGFILTLKFDINKTTMDMSILSFSNEIRVETYEIKIDNNILSYYDNQNSVWKSLLRIKRSDYNDDYMSAYFYLNGDESTLPVGFHKKEIEKEKTTEDYKKYFIDNIWKSEKLDFINFLLSPFEPNSGTELSERVNEINSYMDDFLKEDANVSLNDLESVDTSDINDSLERDDILIDDLKSFGIYDDTFYIILIIDFDSYTLKYNIFTNSELASSTTIDFKINKSTISILNENNEWLNLGDIHIIDNKSFKLIANMQQIAFNKI